MAVAADAHVDPIVKHLRMRTVEIAECVIRKNNIHVTMDPMEFAHSLEMAEWLRQMGLRHKASDVRFTDAEDVIKTLVGARPELEVLLIIIRIMHDSALADRTSEIATDKDWLAWMSSISDPA